MKNLTVRQRFVILDLLFTFTVARSRYQLKAGLHPGRWLVLCLLLVFGMAAPAELHAQCGSSFQLGAAFYDVPGGPPPPACQTISVSVPQGRKFVILEVEGVVEGWKNGTMCNNALLLQAYQNTNTSTLCGAATATITVGGPVNASVQVTGNSASPPPNFSPNAGVDVCVSNHCIKSCFLGDNSFVNCADAQQLASAVFDTWYVTSPTVWQVIDLGGAADQHPITLTLSGSLSGSPLLFRWKLTQRCMATRVL